MEIGQRLKELIKVKNVIQKDLAQHVGVSASYISDIIRGKKVPIDTLAQMCDYIGISLADFFRPMSNEENSPEFLQFQQECAGLTTEDMQFLLIAAKHLKYVRSNAAASSEKPHPAVYPLDYRISEQPHYLPLQGDAAAGIPFSDPAGGEDQIPVPEQYADASRYGVFRARGDSMLPRIRSGNFVIVDFDKPAESGDVALVLLAGLADDEYTIKRISLSASQITLRSFNKSYPDMVYRLSEVRSCKKVVSILDV